MTCWGPRRRLLSEDVTCHVLTFCNGATHAVMSSVNQAFAAIFVKKPERVWSSPRLVVFRLLYGLKNRARQGRCDIDEAKRYVDSLAASFPHPQTDSPTMTGRDRAARAEALSLQGLVYAEVTGWPSSLTRAQTTLDELDFFNWPLWVTAALDGDDWWSWFWLAVVKGIVTRKWASRSAFLNEIWNPRPVGDRPSRVSPVPECQPCSENCIHPPEQESTTLDEYKEMTKQPAAFCLYEQLLKRADGPHGCPVAQHWCVRLWESLYTVDNALKQDHCRRAVAQGNWATIQLVLERSPRVQPTARELHRRDRLRLGSKMVPRWRDRSTCARTQHYARLSVEAPLELKPETIELLGGAAAAASAESDFDSDHGRFGNVT